MDECSPGVKYSGFSCIDNKTIGELFESIKYHKDTQPIPSLKSGDDLARAQLERLRTHTQCKNDFCVAEYLNQAQQVTRFLKPDKDLDWAEKTAWLSNIDIDAVLGSYMRVYPTFYHAGTFPLDFQDKNGMFQTCTSDMCDFTKLRETMVAAKLDAAKLDATNIDATKTPTKVHYISFVFNTHKRAQSGEHWFCAFVDIKDNKLYFNDSVGNQMRYNCRYMTRFKELLTDVFGEFAPIENTVQKQPYGSGECGLYCIFFITTMLEMMTYCEIGANSTAPTWYSKSDKKHSLVQRSENDVFCGRPEDFFMSDVCMSDMKRYNDYMVRLRYEFFNVRDADGHRVRKEKVTYNDCAIKKRQTRSPIRRL
jgi:hypothetical protein